MKRENVIKKFLEGEQAQTPLRNIESSYGYYKGRTLWTRKNELINYNTRIAYIEDNTLYINVKKYSSTTSHIQSKIKWLGTQYNYNIVEYQE